MHIERVLGTSVKKNGGNSGKPFCLFYQGMFQRLKKILAHWIWMKEYT